MKKIYALLFCMTVFAAAFAQTNNRDWNDRNYNNDQYRNANSNVYQNDRDDHRFNSIERRDMMIQRINNEFERRIMDVSFDKSLSRRERRRIINDLKEQKNIQISNVYRQTSYGHFER